MNWKVLTGVILVLYVSVSNTKEIRDTATNIQNGLSVAKGLGDFVVAKNFSNVIGKLATAVTPFLGVVGPLVSFIMGFFGHAESAELQAIKRLAAEVDNRFDKVDLQFNEVKRLIDWSKIEIQYSDIEQKINAVNGDFENIYKFSTKSVKVTTNAFVESFKSDYQNSGAKLYDGIMNKGRVFGNSLFEAVMISSEYDRGKSQTFMLGILQLLMKAAKLELANHQLIGHQAALHDYQNQWSNRFTHLRIKMLSIDSAIVSQYHTQAGKDIENLLIKHPKNTMNNNDFNNVMYAFLAKKYSWRDWFTVTYNDITGSSVHYDWVCGGYGKFRDHGRNVVVASVDGRKAHINMGQAQTIVNNVDSCHPRVLYRPHKHTVYQRTDSDKAYNTFPTSVRDHCDPYAGKGVIAFKSHNGYDVHFKAAPNRFKLRSQENCNFVYVFG